jgi:hypothetical protein
MNCFALERYRFRFTALDDIRFPAGKVGNVVRGAFGLALRETAPTDVYERLFEPQASPGEGPSGLTDRPRPYVFRWARTAGSKPVLVRTGEHWELGLHLFDASPGLCGHFQDAFAAWKQTGIGPGRGRLHLDGMEQLAGAQVDLDASDEAAARIDVHFWTPTELKVGGEIADRPDFPVLFARLRDRIATLCALYQGGPLAMDFRGLGGRAERVAIGWSNIGWERVERTSSRTGQTHPIGGFTGSVEYLGELSEFMPWLRAGEFTGVGRQTAWGKGEISVGM